MEPLRKIFWAFILLFFTLTFNNGEAKIVIVPAFVGYLIILSQTKKLVNYSNHLKQVATPLIILSIFSAISFLISLTGSVIGELQFFIGIFLMGVELWMYYLLLYGFRDIAQVFGFEFEGRQFIVLFPFFAITRIVSWIFLLILPWISILAIFINLAVHIVFLVRLARFSKLNFQDPVANEAPLSL